MLLAKIMKNNRQFRYACMALHGGVDQFDRDSIMSDFKAGKFKVWNEIQID